MADRMQTTPASSEPTTTSLLSGIVTDAQELIKQQLQLFKHELKDDVNRAKEALPSLGLGVVLALTAAILLGFTIAQFLYWAFNPAPGAGPEHLPLWGCYAIVTVVFGAIACGLLYFAKKNLESLPMSREAVQATEENVEWLTKPK
jgi:drug/metabolite transporter (DMT)-like permease